MAVPHFETKSFKITEFKAEGEGKFHAVANAYGVKDSYNEIVDPGCFKRSLDQRGPRRVLLWQHNPDNPIGSGLHSETPNALEVEGTLNLKVQRGAECYELMRAGDIDSMSIGYNVLRDAFDDDGVRHLVEGKLWESSPVTFPANELSLVDAVKAYGYGQHDLPLILDGLTSLRGDVKQGRVLSQANFNLIKEAASILQELLDSVQAAEDSGKSHSPNTVTRQDPKPADELSDSEIHSLIEAAKAIRQAA